MATILFLAADPVSTTRLALGSEMREIDHRIQASPQRGVISVQQAWAVRLGDLQQCLLRHRPYVVHFSGQGSPAGQLLAEGSDGSAAPIHREALAELFAVLRDNIRCVVLSACFSLEQARAITRHIDCVIGLAAALESEVRIVWSGAFYQALGFGKSIEKAVALGENALKLHGFTGAAAPELLLREGVRASAVRIGAGGAPFLVPFSRNPGFVGRERDLAGLHGLLQKGEAVGVRPAMLTGMGGIGKTQLAVEYVHTHREAYPDGIYWVNAAMDWQSEFVRLAIAVGCSVGDAQESERQQRLSRAFAEYLRERLEALIVFDNVEDPRTLRMAGLGFIPTEIGCRLLFTTRRRDVGKHFTSVEVSVLPEDAARALLLSDRAAADEREIEAATMICRRLGHLPLALTLAGAFLGQHPEISLGDYRERLTNEGCLAAVDDAGVEALDLATQHDAAVGATLRLQWEALKSEAARQVLQTATLLGEAVQVPRARLALLTGLSDRAEKGHPAQLGEALRVASQLWLVEELTAEEVRLHPLVREFVVGTIEGRAAFTQASVARMGKALWNIGRLQEEVARRGIDAVLADLRAGAALAAEQRIVRLIRPLDLEAHNLRSWAPAQESGFFLQQIRNCCLALGEEDLQALVEGRLGQAKWPWLRELIPTSRASEALVRTLDDHAADVYGVVITADERFIFTVSYDTNLKVHDLASGQTIRTLEGHADAVSGVAVTADGRFAVSASWDRTLKVWDLSTEHAIRTLKGHSDRVTAVAVTADSCFALSASWDKTVKVWDLATGQTIHTLVGHKSHVTSVAVTADGRFAVSASLDQTLKIWDLAMGQIIRTLQSHTSGILGVTVTIDGRFAVSASEDKTLKVWDLATGQAIRTLHGHTAGVRGVTLTADGRLAVSASEDKTLKVWDLVTRQDTDALQGHKFYVSCVAVTADGRFAVSARRPTSEDWETAEGPLSDFFRGDMATSSDVWDLATGQLIRTRTRPIGRYLSMAVTADGRFALNKSKAVEVWDLATEQAICALVDHEPYIYCLAVTADGRFAVSKSTKQRFKFKDLVTTLWDLSTGQAICTLQGHSSDIVGVAMTTDGRFAVTASKDSLEVWDLATGQAIRMINGDHGVLAANGCFAVTTSKYDLKVWDLATGQTIRTLRGHTSFVNGAALTADGRFAVSSSDDRTLKMWDLATGNAVSTRATGAPLKCCALTPDGRTIVVGDEMGAVHFLDWVNPSPHENLR